MKRFAVITAAIAFAASLIGAMLELAPAPLDLRTLVTAHLAESGVSHPVTAVLLNYRGYDTLLEIAVLLLALLAILAATENSEASAASPPHVDNTNNPNDCVLPSLARLAAPLAVAFGVYLLWAGAHRPGGAFHAGAVLAAAMVLLHLAGLMPAWHTPRRYLRLGIAAGFVIFLMLAAILSTQGALLEYPPDSAGALILLIESGLTFSLALILAGLFLFLSRKERHHE